MNYLLLLTLLIPHLVFAECPHEIQLNGIDYCIHIDWENGERKIRGEFHPTDTSTPYLIPMGEIPQKWIYSKAKLSVWLKNDMNQSLVGIPNFRMFPYMHMENGHHHSTGYDFFFDTVLGKYIIRRIAFQNMRGCWSLRWTTDSEDSKASSQFLMNLTDFENISDEQSQDQMVLCENIGN